VPVDDSPLTNRIPRHVAIVMDGNGRWAKAQGKPRSFGHQSGVETVRKIVAHAGKSGTRHLTLFSFSTENWKRPQEEIQALFSLLRAFVKKDMARLDKENVRVTILGSRENLPKDIQTLIQEIEDKTINNNNLYLNIAFNYGGRDEIVRMVQKIANRMQIEKILPEDVTEEMITQSLDTCGQPDPDMIIRTSGENRISNFLLWQSAYAEFILTDVLWPDFTPADYDEALQTYAGRSRRIGGVGVE